MDYVFTHKGRMRMVTRFVKKSAYDLYEIKIAGCETQTVTPEHPYYARKKSIINKRMTLGEPEWVEAQNLSKDYKVCVPINTESVIPTWDGTVKETHNQYGITTATYVNELNPLMGDEDFWWVVGRYFGDGCLMTKKKMVEICCAFDEHAEIRPRLESIGLNFTERDKRTTHVFTLFGKELCDFLEQFGVGAENKSITPMILNLPVRLLKQFLEGYISADGSWNTRCENPECSITTVSRNLAYGIQQCILKAYGTYGCICRSESNCNVIEGRKVNTKPTYSVHFRIQHTWAKFVIEDGMAWVNVSKVTHAKRPRYESVYTLSVDEDESFTVGNVAVHNCTHFSRARGGKPRSQHIRMLPWAVYEQSRSILPDLVCCENVAEIQTWEDYDAFVDAMRSLGYTFECRELVAADYGAPTIRKRWYAVFRRDGRKTAWPEQSNARSGTIESMTMPTWEPVAKCIDFEDVGESIFARKKPLADATMRRIAAGIERFVKKGPAPFLVTIGYGERKTQTPRVRSVDEPLTTIVAGGCKQYLCTPFLVSYYGNEHDADSVESPLRTITCKDRFGLVTCEVDGETYQLADVHLRMLRPEELKLAQGFPASYVIDRYSDGTAVPKTEQVKRLGNSVVPVMARKIVAANIAA
jgi:DNA (cytosine-5)-methyltransferase 1